MIAGFRAAPIPVQTCCKGGHPRKGGKRCMGTCSQVQHVGLQWAEVDDAKLPATDAHSVLFEAESNSTNVPETQSALVSENLPEGSSGP